MRIALIDENGLVTAINVAKSVAFIEANADKWPHTIAYDVTDMVVGVGDTYNGNGTFTVRFVAAPEPNYEKVFRADTFKADVLTEDEFIAFLDSTNQAIKRVVRLFLNRNGVLNVNDQRYIDLIGVAFSEGIIASQERHDELLLGLPLDA